MQQQKWTLADGTGAGLWQRLKSWLRGDTHLEAIARRVRSAIGGQECLNAAFANDYGRNLSLGTSNKELMDAIYAALFSTKGQILYDRVYTRTQADNLKEVQRPINNDLRCRYQDALDEAAMYNLTVAASYVLLRLFELE